MSIITDDLDGHFRAAKNGVRMSAPPGPLALAVRGNRELPTIGIKHRINGGVGGIGSRGGNNLLIKSGSSNGANVTQVPPEVRNPLLSLINFYLPYDRKTLNQWIRYYFKTDPIVRNCCSLNGQFPISDFRFVGISDPSIERQFEEMKERCGLLRHAQDVSLEDEIIGEAFTFWQWDENDLTWVDYTILNPDRLEVREFNWGSGSNAFYTLDPPEEMKSLLRDPDPYVQQMLETLDPVVLEALASNSRVPLDPFNVMAMMRKDHQYDQRGTSPVMPALKELMRKDKLIEAQYATADQQITPVQLWKVGNSAAGYMATPEQLDELRALLETGKHDFNFGIITHDAVNLELIGFTGKIMPIIPELEYANKQIMIAMHTNEATITGGGPSFGAAVVPFKILQGRFATKRDKMVDTYRKKILKPFAEAREMYQTTQAELNHRIRTKKVPIVPKWEWNFKLDLTDNAQKIQYMMQLRDKSGLPMHSICEVMNLDYGTVKKWLKDEEGTVFDPVYQQSRSKRAEASGSAQGMLDVHGGGAGGAPAGGGGGDEGEAGGEGEAPGGEASPPEPTAAMRRGSNVATDLLDLLNAA